MVSIWVERKKGAISYSRIGTSKKDCTAVPIHRIPARKKWVKAEQSVLHLGLPIGNQLNTHTVSVARGFLTRSVFQSRKKKKVCSVGFLPHENRDCAQYCWNVWVRFSWLKTITMVANIWVFLFCFIFFSILKLVPIQLKPVQVIDGVFER